MQARLLRAISFSVLLQCTPSAAPSNEGSAWLGYEQQLDRVDEPPTGVSLLVLDEAALAASSSTVTELEATLAEVLGGTVYHRLPPRLLVARVPSGVDPILFQLGLRERFQRAVRPDELPGANVAEQRFVRVFSSRYYPTEVPPTERVLPKRRAFPRGEPLEHAPSAAAPGPSASGATLRPGASAPPLIDVPYASGTVVVAVWLPESNGVAEPSTEDWTEDAIVETYAKVQVALEAFSRSEPNARLRFVLHYESSPGHGGLPGTLDSDWEFGKHADFSTSAEEARVTAPLLARLLGHEVAQEQVWEASREYLDGLRERYRADSAFYVKVAANQNWTAGLRAHAYFHGPWTTLSSDYGWQVFAHELGHIFGAADEYCTDICQSASALMGYLGMVNANATDRPEDQGGTGIDDGHGEDMPSLMCFNEPLSINGYTRAGMGWLDLDGDGIVEVLDTLPHSDLWLELRDGVPRLLGRITDLPMSRQWSSAWRSINRIAAVELRPQGGPWMAFEVPAEATWYGVAEVDLALPSLPPGTHRFEVRARNSVGNLEQHARTLVLEVPEPPVDTIARAAPTAPWLVASITPRVGSTRSRFSLEALVHDFAGGPAQLRFDAAGDGTWDTGFVDASRFETSFVRPGLYRPRLEVRSESGATRIASTLVYVLDDNAPPTVTLSAIPSTSMGASSPPLRFEATEVRDADGDSVTLDWALELATQDGRYETRARGLPPELPFTPSVRTPEVLRTREVDLLAGTDVGKATARAVLHLGDNVVAVAAGWAGLFVVDLSPPGEPTLLARLELESGAEQLARDGRWLYVVGPHLSVVDLGNPRAPVEVKQYWSRSATRTTSDLTRLSIPDGDSWGTSHSHFPQFGERVTDLRVEVDVDHPAPRELLITMSHSGTGELVLSDHRELPGGRQTLSFTPVNTASLRTWVGRLASGELWLRVSDTVAGNPGELLASRVVFRTRSRAMPLFSERAKLLGGFDQRYVVAASNGLQVLDVRRPQWIREASRLTGTGTWAGALVDKVALVFGPVNTPPPKNPNREALESVSGLGLGIPNASSAPPAEAPQTRGLYAVDLSVPTAPRVLRQDLSHGNAWGELWAVRRRFYLNPYPEKGEGDGELRTQLCSLEAFVNGQSYVLGRMPERVMPGAFGDDRAIWGMDGQLRVGRWNVSRPEAVVREVEYLRPQHWTLADLGNGRGLLHSDYRWGQVATLLDGAAIISRTYRLSLEAKDARGATTLVSRPLHVVPYNQGPQWLGAQLVSGDGLAATTTEDAVLRVQASDPNRPSSWDSLLAVRADLDGDGSFETFWQTVSPEGTVDFTTRFAAAGEQRVRFQVRDAFFATAEGELTVTVR